jgi:hypothetical protein
METDKPLIEKVEKTEKAPKVKKPKPSRTIDTMLRTTMSNHMHMTMLADRKAALMVSINSIIISIMVSFLVNQFDTYPKLLLPTLLMAAVSLLTITFALLSTKPNTRHKNVVDSLAEPARTDLLFFGDYLSLDLDEYRQQMKQLIRNDEKLYESMVDNIYIQGQVIGRKFRLLKIAYNIFMFGFPVVVLFYIAAIYFS